MGTLEQWEKDLLGQVEPKEVQRDPGGNGGGCCCLGAVLVLLVVLALAVQSWAACYPSNFEYAYMEPSNVGGYDYCSYGSSCPSGNQKCSTLNYCTAECETAVVDRGGTYFTGFYNLHANSSECTNSSESCTSGRVYKYAECMATIKCTTREEADSVDCEAQGKEWKYNPQTGTKECVQDPCEGYEDYLADIKEACRQNGGTDDFELVPNSDGTCGTSGFCDECTTAKKQEHVNAARKNCCQLGVGFDPENMNFQCKTTIDGLNKTWDYNGCNYNFSVNINPGGESYASGCGPSGGGSSDSNDPDQSSPSGGGSSDSQGDLSSDSQGGEVGGDTTGTGGASSASQAEQDINQMAGDISRMVSQDSAQLSNTDDIKQILLDYMRCVYDENCPMNQRDTTIVNVSGGGGGGNVTIDLTALTNAVNAGNAIGEANGAKLDTIAAKIGGLGLDSIRSAIQHGDSSIKAAIDALGGLIGSLDSTAAAIGSRIDSSRSLLASIDSTLKGLGDTTGGGGYDTAGFMATLRAWGDSLNAAVWGYPCDTTGGRKCDNAYIGADGLTNARRDFALAGSALVDSINGGAVGDSIAKWSQELASGGGALSGDGSANCPSVFTRTWTIPLGRASVPFGPFSNMVCHDFGFGLTFWALARVVLRAMVAISCMWWIFKAVTGTEGGNDED